MAECGSSIAEIEKTCGGNAPGLKTTIYIGWKNYVANIPAPNNGTLIITEDIEMEEDRGMYAWEISKGGNNYESNPEGEDENVENEVVIKAFMNKLEEEKSYIMNAVHGGEYILLIPDKNGKMRLIGDLEEGCTIRVKEQTNDKNGYDLTITWPTNHLPYYYDGAIPILNIVSQTLVDDLGNTLIDDFDNTLIN
jgi:hypothetical protein